ncbi:ribosomal RNA processing protein 1 homolog B-like [Lineus longissimus]|uniref:ribosomal RNA processing protein 1 homolog B-like n=1 Tax=Lineus longissimus TaxID=88925 RepID=UPI00315DA10D
MDFEQKLAQKLACNDRTVRDRGVKKLRKYLEARSQSQKNGFSRDDLVKIWKGLHYCMWMSDKPLVQEDLAELISSLIHNLKTPDAAFMFLETFFETECREWYGIDRLRIDKFMMLIRRMFRQTLVVLKKSKWSKNLVTRLLELLSKDLISADGNAPIGVRTHLIDVFYTELTRVASDELSSDQVLTFFEPFIQLYAKGKNKKQMNRFFMEIIIDSDVGLSEARAEKRQDEPPRLNIDYSKMADRLFEVASSGVCRKANRDNMYGIVKKFRNLAEGIFPRDRIADDSDDSITRDDINKAVAQLMAMEKPREKKRKRKRQESDDSDDSDEDAAFSDESDEQVAAPPRKKKKGKSNQPKFENLKENTGNDLDVDDMSQKQDSNSKQSKKNKGKKGLESKGDTTLKRKGKRGADGQEGKSKEGEDSTQVVGGKSLKGGEGVMSKTDEIRGKDSVKKKKKNKENSGEVNQAIVPHQFTVGEKKALNAEFNQFEQKVAQLSEERSGTEKAGKLKKKRRKSCGDALGTLILSKKEKNDGDLVGQDETGNDIGDHTEVEKVSLKAKSKKRRSLGSLMSEMSKTAESSAPDANEPVYSKIKKRLSGGQSDAALKVKVASPGSSKVKVVTPGSSKKSSAQVSAYAKMMEKRREELVSDTPSSGMNKNRKHVNFDSECKTPIPSSPKSPAMSSPSVKADVLTPVPKSSKKWEKTRLDTPARSASLKKKQKKTSPVHEFDFLTPTNSGKKKKLTGTPVGPSSSKKGKTQLTNIAEENPEPASAKIEKNLFAAFEKVKTPPAVFVKKAVTKVTPKVTPKAKQNETPKKKSPKSATSSEKKKKSKRVSFIMARNMEQDFKDSLNVSPVPPFVPDKRPENSILKSPAVTPKQMLRAKQLQLLLKNKTPTMSPLAKSPKSVQRMMQKKNKNKKRSSI